MTIYDRYFTVNYSCPHCKAPGTWVTKGLPPGCRVSHCQFWCKVCKKLIDISFEFGDNHVALLGTWKGAVTDPGITPVSLRDVGELL